MSEHADQIVPIVVETPYRTPEAVAPNSFWESVLLPIQPVPTTLRSPCDASPFLSVHETPAKGSGISPLRQLVRTEVSAPVGCAPLSSSRCLCISCVPLDPANTQVSHTPKRTKPRSKKQLAALKSPNAASFPEAAVRDAVSFIRDTCVPTAVDMTVDLHIYDLSQGYLKTYGTKLVGSATAGVFHTGIVCYGVEVYFEGGIGVAGAGRTRFGDQYVVHRLGITRKTVTGFFRWINVRSTQVYQIHDYHPVRHNCHHFAQDAVQFLLGEAAIIPSYLFSTVDELVKTDVGAAVSEFLTYGTHGLHSAIARQLRAGLIERQCSVDMQLSASTACGIMALPPTAAVLFRVNDHHCAKRFLLDLAPYVKELLKKNRLKPAALTILEEAATAFMSGTDAVLPQLVLNYMEMVTEALVRTPVEMWGPIFNGLRVALLHKLCVIHGTFNSKFMSLLKYAARSFPRLLPDGRLGFLRVLCNFACSAHGAVMYCDNRYRDSWVSVVGLGLMDSNGAVVYAAACLALNLSLAIVTTSSSSLVREMKSLSDEHYALRLATVLLYNLRHRDTVRLAEPSFNMTLMALYHIASSNCAALEFVVHHFFSLRYSELLDRCASNESRALVCLLKTLEDLYG